jgi:hypothetical protein
MKSKFIVLAVLSALLLTACSDSPNTPPYDEASLIDYRACVENYVATALRSPFGGNQLTVPTWTEQASESCADLLHYNF